MQKFFPSLMKTSRRSLYLPFSMGHFANDIVPCSVVVLAQAIALEMGLNPMEVWLLLTLHILVALQVISHPVYWQILSGIVETS